jgi:hypothetical protein
MANGNKPAHIIRIGYIKCTIWRNEEFYNSTITRSWKNDRGDWADGDSFGHADLPVVAKVADMAADWISAQ